MKTEMEKGMDTAVKFLSFRSRTEKEVFDHLIKKKYSENTIKEIIERLKEYHYIDDRAYLKNYLFANSQMNRYGKIRLRHDLKRRSLPQALIEEMDLYYPQEREKEFCQELVHKYKAQIRGQSIGECQKKLYTKLQRLGYEGTMIRDCFAGLSWQEIGPDEAKNRQKLEADYEKYHSRHQKKGYRDNELKQRILRSLAGQGYTFEQIKEIMDEKKAHDSEP